MTPKWTVFTGENSAMWLSTEQSGALLKKPVLAPFLPGAPLSSPGTLCSYTDSLLPLGWDCQALSRNLRWRRGEVMKAEYLGRKEGLWRGEGTG